MSFVEKLNDTTRSSYYDICSFTYLLAMVTSNKTQSWVNYLTQVVGKSYTPVYPFHDCGSAGGQEEPVHHDDSGGPSSSTRIRLERLLVALTP